MQELCCYRAIIENILAHYGLLVLGCCQWMVEQQLIERKMGAIVVVHTVVLLAIHQNSR